MPKKGSKEPLPEVGLPGDAQGLTRSAREYMTWMAVRGNTPSTIRGVEKALRLFLRWCGERSLARAPDVTRPILERYQRHLYHYRKANGQPLTLISQYGRLQVLRGYFRWLTRSHLILSNPAADLELPRLPKRLPKAVLTSHEVERVLSIPGLDDPAGLRDRAILEVLYSTGMRRSELLGLRLHDLDPDRGLVTIREGKGRKDRIVPVGGRALQWVRKYLDEVRPTWVILPDAGVLFLNHCGEPLDPGYLTHRVRRYVLKADLGKSGSCHLFRHTMATLMLENGADIRFIQAMLGHAKLETTQIYTRVSVHKLKEIHTATHPAGSVREASEGGGRDASNSNNESAALVVDTLLAAESAEEQA